MAVAFKPTRSPQRQRTQNINFPSTSSKVISLDRARRKRVGRTQGDNVPDIPAPATTQAQAQKVVPVLPTAKPTPAWLRSLMGLHRLSALATYLMVGATLSVYGLTVYAESSWTKQYPQLEGLRHQEQQLRTAKEILKHQLAKDATAPNTGLVEPKPGDMIYLEPAPPRPEIVPQEPAPLEGDATSSVVSNKPLGY